MPKYSVTVNRTVMSSVEIEVTAKDEEAAQAKAEEKIHKVLDSDRDIEKAFEWEEQMGETTYEYEVTPE